MNEFIDLSDDIVNLNTIMYESIVDMPKVLGKMRGTFFCPDRISRNDRYYSENLWIKQLGRADVQRSLVDGMTGTLLHPTDQKMSHPMYASHVVKKLWIDEQKNGIGEAYILDTPVGRIIDTFQKAKDENGNNLMNLYVSSRAWGKYKEGTTHNGVPVVDEDNFIFKTFDVVLEPGFLQAKPQFESMVESLADCYINHIKDAEISKVQKESKAVKFLRDIDLILKGLK